MYPKCSWSVCKVSWLIKNKGNKWLYTWKRQRCRDKCVIKTVDTIRPHLRHHLLYNEIPVHSWFKWRNVGFRVKLNMSRKVKLKLLFNLDWVKIKHISTVAFYPLITWYIVFSKISIIIHKQQLHMRRTDPLWRLWWSHSWPWMRWSLVHSASYDGDNLCRMFQVGMSCCRL